MYREGQFYYMEFAAWALLGWEYYSAKLHLSYGLFIPLRTKKRKQAFYV